MPNEASKPSPVGHVLRGTATTGPDTIVVIGSEDQALKTRTFEFCLIARTRDQRAAEWQMLKEYGDPFQDMLEGPEDVDQANVVQFLRNVHEGYDVEPPSVLIALQPADRDLGTDGSWVAYCEVPPEVFDAIIADMRDGRCSELSCSLELSPFLTDAWYAPVSEPATIGLLKQGKYDAGSSRGWVKSVTWAPVGALPPEQTSFLHRLEDEERERVRLKAEEEDYLDTALPSTRELMRNAMGARTVPAEETALAAIASLARTIKMGFWLLLALILLVAIVR